MILVGARFSCIRLAPTMSLSNLAYIERTRETVPEGLTPRYANVDLTNLNFCAPAQFFLNVNIKMGVLNHWILSGVLLNRMLVSIYEQ